MYKELLSFNQWGKHSWVAFGIIYLLGILITLGGTYVQINYYGISAINALIMITLCVIFFTALALFAGYTFSEKSKE